MRILCLGDSNTYGYDPRSYFGERYHTEDRWVDLLASQTGHTLINAGSNGREIPRDSSALGLFAEPDLLLVMLGTNDLLQGVSAKEAATRMEAFLRSAIPYCKQLLLVAPPPVKRGDWVPTNSLVDESVRLAEEYRLVAETLHIPFVDTRHWDIDLTFDGVHFTEAGHQAFADCLIKYI